MLIQQEWIDANKEASEALPKLSAQIATIQAHTSGSAASPVKLLANVFENHGNLIRWVDQIEDIYGAGFKVKMISRILMLIFCRIWQ